MRLRIAFMIQMFYEVITWSTIFGSATAADSRIRCVANSERGVASGFTSISSPPVRLGRSLDYDKPAKTSGGAIGRVWDISPNRWQKDAHRSAPILELPISAT